MFLTDRVQFDRPDLPHITQQYTAFDLHFHSRYSDGLSSISKIAQRARKLGIGIAITDHNDIRGALEIEQYTDVLSIPGIEITASEGSHLLVYFYDSRQLRDFYRRYVAPHMGHGIMSSLDLTMAQIIERAREYPSLVMFPHPYSAMYTGVYNAQFSKNQVQSLLEMADGVEVINANNLNKWNLKCALLGFNLDKCMVGGSDGHSLSHMGRVITYAQCPSNRRDFLEAVRYKTNMVVGKEISLIRKLTSNGLKLRSNLSNGQDLFEKSVRYGRKVVSLKSQAIHANVRQRILSYK
jgi:predicted metal-dependent phosphoesterase TrpH